MKKSDFLKLRYFDKGKAWYIIPRAQYFNGKNVEELYKVLALLKRKQYVKIKDLTKYQTKLGEEISPDTLIYRVWTQKTKFYVFKEMTKLGIIKPYAKGQSLNDQLANLRNHTNLLKKLGFAFFNKQKHLFISEVGEEFLESKKNKWFEILERQLTKIQFWNPSITTKEIENYKEFNLFPFIFTINLILNLKEQYLSVEEFILFVSHAKTHKDKDVIINLIEEYRKLSRKEQLEIKKRAKFSSPELANAIVTMGLFGSSPTFSFSKNKLEFRDIDRAEDLMERYSKRLRFIEYVCFEDWYQFVGRKKPEITISEGLQYYGELGQEEKAKKFLETYAEIPEAEIEEGLSFEDMLKQLFSEKLLEDYLEKQVQILEKGLKLVKNGRQYPTEIGRIDLLAIDSNGRYVVIELKKDKLEDKVMGQTLRYMGWVKGNLSKTMDVKGIIVGQEITEKLRYAKKGLQYSSKLMKLQELSIDIKGRVEVAEVNV